MNLKLLIEKIRFSEITMPLAFLGVLTLAFGLLIPWLGIYQDDWLFVYNNYARGAQGLWDFLYADGTPFASFINIGLFALLGFKPIYWHIGSLLARWLTITIFWMTMRRLWPAIPRQTFLAGLIFAIHPFFNLQPLSYTFLHIWLGYFFLGLSFYWMLISIQNNKNFWLYLGLSLLAETVSILTLEYFTGLEFLRPIMLWLALRDIFRDPKQRILRAFKLWIPYLLVFIVYIYWRFFIYSVPIKDRNSPIMIQTLFTNPLAGIQLILYNLIPDTLLITLASWFKVFDPALFDWFNGRNFLFTLFGFLTMLAAWLYLSRQSMPLESETTAGRSWAREMFWFGLVIAVFGLIPPYVGGLFINEKNPLWNSRFGMASMLGASLMLVAGIESLIESKKSRLIIFAALVGFSVSYHARYVNDFRLSWKKQANFYHQLVLRIPALETNTAIVAEGEIFPHMGDYPTAYAINTMFSVQGGDLDDHVGYWFFSITSNFENRTEDFINGMDLFTRHRSLRFKGRSDESLIISFEPEQGQCLHIVRSQDADSRSLRSLLRRTSHLSHTERILPSPTSGLFLKEIGFDFPVNWCTFYVQADLARQNNDWNGVVRLWKAAARDGFSPNDPFEYLPFIEAFARLNEWDKAVELTLMVSNAPPISRFTLCDFWESLPASSERDSAYYKINDELSCKNR